MNEYNQKGKAESRERFKTLLPVRGALRAPPRLGESAIDKQAITAKSLKLDESIRIKELDDEDEEEEVFISIGIDFGTT